MASRVFRLMDAWKRAISRKCSTPRWRLSVNRVPPMALSAVAAVFHRLPRRVAAIERRLSDPAVRMIHQRAALGHPETLTPSVGIDHIELELRTKLCCRAVPRLPIPSTARSVADSFSVTMTRRASSRNQSSSCACAGFRVFGGEIRDMVFGNILRTMEQFDCHLGRLCALPRHPPLLLPDRLALRTSEDARTA